MIVCTGVRFSIRPQRYEAAGDSTIGESGVQVSGSSACVLTPGVLLVSLKGEGQATERPHMGPQLGTVSNVSLNKSCIPTNMDGCVFVFFVTLFGLCLCVHVSVLQAMRR
jgi:hypothetical protein